MTEKAAEILRAVDSEMFMDYVLRVAEAVARERNSEVSLEKVLKSRPVREYARKLGVENRLEGAL